MNRQFIFTLLFFGSVFISSVSQVLLKRSTLINHERKLKEYLNPFVITAYFLFFIATLITVVAYKHVPLSMGPVIEASGYLFITLISRLFLKEKISKKKILGMVIIIVGTLIFTL